MRMPIGGGVGQLAWQRNASIQEKQGRPTFSAAGHGALEGARDRLSGFLLGRSLFQGGGVGQLTGGGGHL